MKEDKSLLLQSAMQYGLILGIFWIVKYLFIILNPISPIFGSIGSVMSFGTVFLLFFLLSRYRQQVLHRQIGFWHGVQFSVFLFLFASMLEAVAAYIHIAYIEPEYINNLYESLSNLVSSLDIDNNLKEAIANQSRPSPINYIFSVVIFGDIFAGFILSLPIVSIVRRTKIKVEFE